MALFSCGTLAHDQMLLTFASILDKATILPEEVADILLLDAHGDADDAGLRAKLIAGLSTLLSADGTRYRPDVNSTSFHKVLSQADLSGLFRNDRRDPRSVQLKALIDIQSGLDVLALQPATRERLQLPDGPVHAWLREVHPGLDTSPLEIMRKGEKGTDLIACFVCAANGIIEPTDVLIALEPHVKRQKQEIHPVM